MTMRHPISQDEVLAFLTSPLRPTAAHPTNDLVLTPPMYFCQAVVR